MIGFSAYLFFEDILLYNKQMYNSLNEELMYKSFQDYIIIKLYSNVKINLLLESNFFVSF